MKFGNLFSKKTSRQVAKDRLKILLISDRVSCCPETMELIKNDITKVISKYMRIDTESMDIQLIKTDSKGRLKKNPVLYANIPILDVRNTIHNS